MRRSVWRHQYRLPSIWFNESAAISCHLLSALYMIQQQLGSSSMVFVVVNASNKNVVIGRLIPNASDGLRRCHAVFYLNGIAASIYLR